MVYAVRLRKPRYDWLGCADDPTSRSPLRRKRAPHGHPPAPCVRPFRGRRRRHCEWKTCGSRGQYCSLMADFRLSFRGSRPQRAAGHATIPPIARERNQKPTGLELAANSCHSAARPLRCTDLCAAKVTILVSCPIVVLRDCPCERIYQVILIHGFCKKTHCSVL